MNSTYRYEVVAVETPLAITWTVVEYHGSHCRGGDKHWLTKGKAQAAQLVYEMQPELHGAAERVVLNAIHMLSLTPNRPRYIDTHPQ
jgi:hypothetical protein